MKSLYIYATRATRHNVILGDGKVKVLASPGGLPVPCTTFVVTPSEDPPETKHHIWIYLRTTREGLKITPVQAPKIPCFDYASMHRAANAALVVKVARGGLDSSSPTPSLAVDTYRSQLDRP